MAWGVSSPVLRGAPIKPPAPAKPAKTTGASLTGLRAAPAPGSTGLGGFSLASTGAAPFATKPSAAPAAKPINTTPQVSPTQAAAPPPDPYDSQYYADLGDATQQANATIAANQLNIGNARTALQSTYANLAHQLALNNTQSQNDENARGGFAQGALGTTLQNNAYATQQQTTQATTDEQNQENEWNNAISGAQQGLSTETIALGLASAARKAALVAGSQGLLGTSAPAAPKPATAPKTTAPKTPPKTAGSGTAKKVPNLSQLGKKKL